jgi:hypothetical protein
MPIYESKNDVHSETFFSRLKFYVPFVLVAIRCNKVDYWLKSEELEVQFLTSTKQHNYRKLHTLKNTNASNELKSIYCY